MVLESQRAPMTLLQLAALAVGALLLVLGRPQGTWPPTPGTAGFLLGALVFGLGAVALVLGEARRVEVGPAGVRLVVTWRGGRVRRVDIPVADIRDLALSGLGDATDGTRAYDLVVLCRDGREVHLFGGCAFEGRLDRDRLEGLRQEARQILGLGA